MSKAEHSPPEALRLFFRAGQPDAPRSLPPLLAEAAALFSAPTEPGLPAAIAGEWTFLLASGLRTQRDPALAARLLQTLAAAGRLGRAFAGLHIQSRALPLPQLTPLLLALPGRDFLLLLNDMFLDLPPEDKQLTAWLKSLLPTPGRLDQREAILFLKTLATPQTGENALLAPPLRNAMLAAGLGDSISKALKGTPGAATADVLLLTGMTLKAPTIREAALAYALRTAGTAANGQSRIAPLLAAPPDLEQRDTALIAEMRRMVLAPDAARRLQATARTEPETLGLVLADMLKSGGPQALAAQRLLPILPRLGVQSCLAELPQAAHGQILLRIFDVLAPLEPDFLRRAAKALGQETGLQGTAAQAIATLLANPLCKRPKQHAASPYNTKPWQDCHPLPVGPGPEAPKNDKARRAELAQAMQNAYVPIKDQNFSHLGLTDETVEGLNIGGGDLSRCVFSQVMFQRVRISAAQMAQCDFNACRFQACVFSGVDLSHSLLQNCRFEACTFDFCDLSRVRFHNCAFTDCSISESSLAGGELAKTRLDVVRLRTCALSGMRLHECSLARLTLTRSDLTGSLWERCLCRDTAFQSCTFSAMRMLGCECFDLRLTRFLAHSMLVLGGHTDNPNLALAERTTRARLLENVFKTPAAPDPALTAGGGAAFVRACVEKYLRVDEARATLTAMRSQDHRRRDLAQERLTEGQGQFLRLLPTLLGTDVFERAQGINGVPVCTLSGHTRAGVLPRDMPPLLERLFPGVSPALKPNPTLLIEAVYAIGSLGSVAQKPSSDVDCWVCLAPMPGAGDEIPAATREALARKLSALEAWAGELFELEVHFFPMNMADVRRNNFGISDKESSGSAQAALLKEEFYRTALKLAGGDLLWWAAPPAATQSEAQALHDDLALFAPRTAAELVDLGQPMPIPPEEYFGACLWQMVKALHSPYKSVMKLGLLEKYAGQGKDMRLLCDRIKEAVLRGRKLAEDVDPYLSLFTSIRKHYRTLSDATSLGLIGECLRLKADVAPEDLPPEFDTQPQESPLATAIPASEHNAFAAALRLGGMVNLFMISAYRRIQEGIRADKSAAHITPQDMTRLGRRIAANFSQQPNKVGLVPFLADDLTFTELSFHAEKAPGKRTIWAVRGKDKSVGKTAVESLPSIRRDPDMARLIAWLVFNGLHDSKQAVLAEKTLAPIALLDLQSLLTDMATFFPRRATLEPDLDEYLKPERVVRAYVIVNLPVAADKNKILTLSAIYATNWGEVFCQTFENPPPAKLKSTSAFLRETLAKPMPQAFELRIFTPKKSACPRLKPN